MVIQEMLHNPHDANGKAAFIDQDEAASECREKERGYFFRRLCDAVAVAIGYLAVGLWLLAIAPVAVGRIQAASRRSGSPGEGDHS